jgi:hypothetical protein
MVYVDFDGSKVSGDVLEADLRERGILTRPAYDRVRLVLHHGIDASDVDFVIESIGDALRVKGGATVARSA